MKNLRKVQKKNQKKRRLVMIIVMGGSVPALQLEVLEMEACKDQPNLVMTIVLFQMDLNGPEGPEIEDKRNLIWLNDKHERKYELQQQQQQQPRIWFRLQCDATNGNEQKVKDQNGLKCIQQPQ